MTGASAPTPKPPIEARAVWRAVKDDAVSRKPWVVEHSDGRLLRAAKRHDQTVAPIRRWKHASVANIVAHCENNKDSKHRESAA